MLRVFVALGKQMPRDKAMIEDTQCVAKLLAKYGCTMVQGGAKIGLMGLVVNEFQKYSDEVVMIVPEVHKSDLIGTKNKEFYIVEGESDRMRITIHTCDMMVVLPGGSGTLAEIAYYNETRKSGEHNAKIVVVNTSGYYNKLFKFHKHQIKSGFMTPEACAFDVVNNAEDLEPIIQSLIAEKQAELKRLEQKKEREKKAKATKKSTSKKSTKSAEKVVAKKPTKSVVKDVADKEIKKEKVDPAKNSGAKVKEVKTTTNVKKVADNVKQVKVKTASKKVEPKKATKSTARTKKK